MKILKHFGRFVDNDLQYMLRQMIDSSTQVTGSEDISFWSALHIKKVHRGKMTMLPTAVGHHVRKKKRNVFKSYFDSS